MKLLWILLLLIIQGHSFICQKAEVRGPEGGTLTAYCKYTSGWESYKKWWCRGKHWNSCRILVKTTGSERLMKKGQASIQDDHGIRTINMTLEELRRDDADTYRCGIEKTGKDLGYKFSVIIDPAPDPTDFPKTVPRPTMASHTLLPSTQGLTSSQPVINPGSRVLLCNLRFALLTSVKGSLLGFLLCTLMSLSWSQGTQGKNRVSLSRRTTAPVPLAPPHPLTSEQGMGRGFISKKNKSTC